MASNAKDKFDAAVKVIRGLPANGPFQPSHDLMLKFYSYFKQATEGHCTLPKPSFWDVVNKKKWEAWSSLGNMESERAMLLYVDELKKIVETMPQTEEVNMFLQKLDTFYEMVEETKQDNHNNNVKDIQEEGQGEVPNGDLLESAGVKDVGNQEENALNYSDNVSLLLKQDMKRAHESSGLLMSEDRKNSHQNGVVETTKPVVGNGFVRNGFNGQQVRVSDDDYDEEDEDRESTDDEIDENVVVVESSQKFSSPPPSSSLPVDKEEGGEGGGPRNGMSEWSESETENEEFCDTSDEPVLQNIPEVSATPLRAIHSHRPSTIAAPSSYHIPHSTSTPIPPSSSSTANKTLRINSGGHSKPTTTTTTSQSAPHSPTTSTNQRRLLSASMQVNASGIDAERQNETMMMNASNFSLFAGPASSSQGSASPAEGAMSCRGGEEEGRDRRRRGGGQSSRGTTSGRRGASGAGGIGRGGTDDQDRSTRYPYPNSGGDGSRDPTSGNADGKSDLNEQIVVTLLRLQRDMSGVLNRLNSLEELVKEGRREREKRRGNKSWWWPFHDLSFKSAMLIFMWPIVLQVVMGYLARRRRKLHR